MKLIKPFCIDYTQNEFDIEPGGQLNINTK